MVLAACSAPEAPGELAEPYWRQPVDAWAGDTLPIRPARSHALLSLTLVSRIGAVHDERGYAFGNIADVEVVRDGDLEESVFVLDGLERSVKRFGIDGRMRNRFGGRGGGPGEFEDPANLFLMPAKNAIGVWDPGLQRVSVFSLAGDLLWTKSMAVDGDHGVGDLAITRRVRRMLASSTGVYYDVYPNPVVVDPGDQVSRIEVADESFERRTTVLEFRVPPTTVTYREGGAATYYRGPTPFHPRAVWSVAKDEDILALAPGGPYQIAMLEGNRHAQLLAATNWRPVLITDTDLEIWATHALATGTLGDPSAAPPMPEYVRYWRGIFPAVAPAITDLLMGPRGSVWVRRFDTEDSPLGRSRRWDVIDPEQGSVVGVVFPVGFNPVAIDCDLVVGVSVDTLLEPYFEIYTWEGPDELRRVCNE